jgi:hypothetical protein
MIIIGSGLAGCLASALIPGSKIYEPKHATPKHKAILRFRSDQIGKALGIPFKKVTVHKGIWHNDHPVQLAPKYIVRYARKVSQKITDRSIIHQETVERYIAPDNFHEILLDMAGTISYNYDTLNLYGDDFHTHKISTIPMEVLCDLFDIPIKINTMISDPIYVSRYDIPDCDIHMTNYYTGTNTSIYRASISGNEIIIESSFPIDGEDINIIKQSFGLDAVPFYQQLFNYEQLNGKITSFDDKDRKNIIFQLTKVHGIYSLGRFAIWKNIVLDDVYKDILRIKEWSNQSEYDRVVR